MKQMATIAYFRSRGNDQAPLFEAKFAHDADAMRKHVDFFECGADGVALDGRSTSAPKVMHNVSEEVTTQTDGGGTVTLNKRPIKQRRG